MASGTYGRVAIAASSNTVVVPSTAISAANIGVITLNIVNTSTTAAVIRVALTTTAGSPAANNSEYIEYNTVLYPYGTLERTGIVLNGGLSVTAYANQAGVVAQAWGMENYS
jgi:hypothetical protein